MHSKSEPPKFFDFHVFSTLLFRGWNVLAGTAMLLFIPLWLSKDAQGYYFTFASLVALQVFFELGLNQVIVQVVAHEAAHLKFDGKEISGPNERTEKLRAFVLLLRRWYASMAGCFLILVGAAGFFFFSWTSNEDSVSWIAPWFLLVLSASANLYFSCWLALSEGFGKIGEVARLRLIQSMAGYSLMWAALAGGAGLYAAPLVPAVAGICTCFWLHAGRGEIAYLKKMRAPPDSPTNAHIDWRTEIFPLQWKIALSWVSGYLIFQMFTPLAFRIYGPAEAGRLGLSLSVFTAITAVGMSWVSAKIPIFSNYIAKNDRKNLDAEFQRVALASVLVITALSLSVVLLVSVAREFDLTYRIASRLADLPVLVMLAITTSVNAKIFADAIYMRAHKEEPMVLNSVVTGLLVGSSVLIFMPKSLTLAMGAYLVVSVCVTLPWTIALRRSYRTRSFATV